VSRFSFETPEGTRHLDFESSDGQLRVAGQSYACDGQSVWIGGRRVPFWVHREKDKLSVWLDGEVFQFTHHDPRQRREDAGAAGSFSGQLKAQMPGKILSLSVAEGQAVTAGQNLLVMESMKMELGLDAPRDGTVESVEVAVGQLVAQGQLLIRLAET
jgi:3-methylcrotonyl-CoA carboxylase alpha subunit